MSLKSIKDFQLVIGFGCVKRISCVCRRFGVDALSGHSNLFQRKQNVQTKSSYFPWISDPIKSSAFAFHFNTFHFSALSAHQKQQQQRKWKEFSSFRMQSYSKIQSNIHISIHYSFDLTQKKRKKREKKYFVFVSARKKKQRKNTVKKEMWINFRGKHWNKKKNNKFMRLFSLLLFSNQDNSSNKK